MTRHRQDLFRWRCERDLGRYHFLPEDLLKRSARARLRDFLESHAGQQGHIRIKSFQKRIPQKCSRSRIMRRSLKSSFQQGFPLVSAVVW